MYLGHISALPFIGEAVELSGPDERDTVEVTEDPVPFDTSGPSPVNLAPPPSMFVRTIEPRNKR